MATTPSIDSCIAACTACQRICIETVGHCLARGGAYAEPKHVNLLLACADICATSANTMLRDVELHTATCAACAQLCGACASACEGMDDDEAMPRCAEACRRCESECAAMSGE
ncbi:four-helix bundle copper-binding protein [Coralloluteibacterium stylophorae]|uniref:Four-helix bundle copper-binding protein n=1 Tax=Coralloluteibacterium stylophorae TaxID=1776034 RepID=A0A8J7VQK2_9GAMM|nr:four-helix bundle copper-binding protein [Coralloluteibacterium stylophorae]MBS7455551.1 four-helix bundle copper-binding protein [Coralloluteibacterium stylophorae]